MSSLILTFQLEEDAATLRDKFQKDADLYKEQLVAIEDLIRRLKGGIYSGRLTTQIATASPVAASATATLVTVAADDTIIIGGTTLTAKASPAGESEFSQAGTDAVDATSLATVINAHSVLSLLVKASAASNVVTITALQAGVVGNQIAVSRVGAPITLSADALAGGTGGASEPGVTYSLGI